MGEENIIELNEDNFQEKVLDSGGKILVDFWAAWCGPCKQIAPIIEELAEEYADELQVGKVDVDENQSLAAEYEVMSIPSLILFVDGEIVNKQVGMISKKELEDFINN